MRSFVLPGLMLFLSLPVSADEILPTPNEVRDHLRRWREDFVVLRIGYENRWTKTSSRLYREFLITDTKEYRDAEEWYRPDERPTKKVLGGNQKTRFQAGYVRNPDDSDWLLTSVKNNPRKSANVGIAYTVQPMWPLLDPFNGTWLDETLLDHEVTVKPGGTINGEECLLVEVVYPKERKFAGDQFWLAVNKDFLVKQTKPMKSEVLFNPHYYCERFEFDGKRWYPARGTIGDGRESLGWEVTKFEVNPKVSPSLFHAPDASQLRVAQRKARANSSVNTVPSSNGAAPSEKLPEALPDGWGVGVWSALLVVFSVCIGAIGYWWSHRAT